jgi:predicted transcriptional regulator
MPEMGNGEAGMMTVSEVARSFGMTPQGVRDAIAAGRLPARRVVPEGRSPLRPIYLIDGEDVESYRRDHRGAVNRTRVVASPEERTEMEAAGYLTITRAAALIGVDVETIRRVAQAGKVGSVKRSILWIKESDARRFKADRDAKIGRMGNG